MHTKQGRTRVSARHAGLVFYHTETHNENCYPTSLSQSKRVNLVHSTHTQTRHKRCSDSSSINHRRFFRDGSSVGPSSPSASSGIKLDMDCSSPIAAAARRPIVPVVPLSKLLLRLLIALLIIDSASCDTGSPNAYIARVPGVMCTEEGVSDALVLLEVTNTLSDTRTDTGPATGLMERGSGLTTTALHFNNRHTNHEMR